MSTGKRLAKRSIIGTRVCAQWSDGIFYSGVIQEVKTPSEWEINVLRRNSENSYKVLFDGIPIATALAPNEKQIYNGFENTKIRTVKEYNEYQLIGSGFQSLSGYQALAACSLQAGQKVYLTYNGREVSGIVANHKPEEDEVIVNVAPPGQERTIELKKKLEEVRLLESRKSARLMDQDTDFARLADMAGDRKRASSHSIDVPIGQGSRKRRTSTSNDEKDGDYMNECTAALVLMSLSCSPHSPHITGLSYEPLSPSPSSDICSWRSGGRSPTPSPPLSEGGSNSSIWNQNTTDEGIVIDEFDDIPRKKRTTRIEYRCTWPGCCYLTSSVSVIEHHVRQTHLGPKKTTDLESDLSDHEEEFYFTEVEVFPNNMTSTTPPVHPHKDMCRPPHEDPDYQKNRGFTVNRSYNSTPTANTPWSSISKQMKLGNNGFVANQSSLSTSNRTFSFGNSEMSWQQTSLSASAPNKINVGKTPGSPTRKARGETKKCRKVYGMEHRELWCTQCKWKKACSRFGD